MSVGNKLRQIRFFAIGSDWAWVLLFGSLLLSLVNWQSIIMIHLLKIVRYGKNSYEIGFKLPRFVVKGGV